MIRLPPREDGVVGESASGPSTHILRDVVFAPIGGEALSQQTVRRIAEAIGLGLLGQGERLPSEADLSEWLGISVMTLREALAVLRHAGYIETFRGRSGGTFVRKLPPAPTVEQARDAIHAVSPTQLWELTAARRAISGEASALAAVNASFADVERLARLAEQMSTVTSFSEYRQLDALFHIGIASIARSRRIAAEETQLQVEFGTVMTALQTLYSGDSRPALSPSNREHAALVQALRDRDPGRARAVLIEHVTGSYDLLMALRGRADAVD